MSSIVSTRSYAYLVKHGYVRKPPKCNLCGDELTPEVLTVRATALQHSMLFNDMVWLRRRGWAESDKAMNISYWTGFYNMAAPGWNSAYSYTVGRFEDGKYHVDLDSVDKDITGKAICKSSCTALTEFRQLLRQKVRELERELINKYKNPLLANEAVSANVADNRFTSLHFLTPVYILATNRTNLGLDTTLAKAQHWSDGRLERHSYLFDQKTIQFIKAALALPSAFDAYPPGTFLKDVRPTTTDAQQEQVNGQEARKEN